MKRVAFVVLALATTTMASAADGRVEETISASNGVAVNVSSDDFAGRAEYTAPKIKLGEYGMVFIAAIKKQGQLGPTMISGFVVYSGSWRFYDRALFRGGAEATAIFADRQVVTCAGSRYNGGCTVSEGFQITPTAAQVAQFAANGTLDIQLSAKGQNAVMLNVPVTYIQAVDEVAKRSAPSQ